MLVCSIYARPHSEDKGSAYFSCKWAKDLVTYVSAPLAWTVIICQPLIALPNNLEYFNLFHLRCFPNWLWSGNVCQITNKWEKRLCCWTRYVQWALHILGSLKCFVRFVWHTMLSAMTWMCLWCGKGIKNSSLPSLHQECVPPDFGFPVGFESGKTKRRKFREFIWPMNSPSATVCQGTQLANIMEVDHGKLKTLWFQENGVNGLWALNGLSWFLLFPWKCFQWDRPDFFSLLCR